MIHELVNHQSIYQKFLEFIYYYLVYYVLGLGHFMLPVYLAQVFGFPMHMVLLGKLMVYLQHGVQKDLIHLIQVVWHHTISQLVHWVF